MLSVVVLAHGEAAATRRCLAALRRYTPGDLEVLLVDNASAPAEAAVLRALAASWTAVQLTRNSTNVPFAAAVNSAMRRARGRLLCWLNNDALVGPGWRSGLERALRADPRAGAAGPRTGATAPPEQLRRGGRPRPTPFLGGFCFLLRRETLEQVGFLDERFVWGWEDMDYCIRMRQAGLRLLLVPGVHVRHEGSRTIRKMPSPRRRATDLSNRGLFLEKWVDGKPWSEDALSLLEAFPSAWGDRRPALSVLLPVGTESASAAAGLLARAVRGVDAELVTAGGWAASARAARAFGGPARTASVPPGTSVTSAWNAALVRAKARHVVFLHPDARPAPGCLAALLSAARSGRWAATAPRSALTRSTWQARPGPDGDRPFFRGGCLLVDRRALSSVGGLDERLLAADAEADLCLRLRQAGGTLFFAAQARVSGRPDIAPEARRVRESRRVMFEKWGAHPFATEIF